MYTVHCTVIGYEKKMGWRKLRVELIRGGTGWNRLEHEIEGGIER